MRTYRRGGDGGGQASESASGNSTGRLSNDGSGDGEEGSESERSAHIEEVEEVGGESVKKESVKESRGKV